MSSSAQIKTRLLTLGFEVNKVCSFGLDMNDCDTRGKHDLQTFFDPDSEHFPFGKDENVFKIPPLPRNFQLLAKNKNKTKKQTKTKPEQKQQQQKAQQINFRETLKP